MKRFALIFSFIAALLFGATVSAQMGPPGPPGPPGPGGLTAVAKIAIYTHWDAPVTYDDRTALKTNELIRLVMYVPADGEAVPSVDSELPFCVRRDGSIVVSSDYKGTAFCPQKSGWVVETDSGEFPLQRFTDNYDYLGVSYCQATISDKELKKPQRAAVYAVFMDTRSVPVDADKNGIIDSYICSGNAENLGKSEYLASFRAVYLGELNFYGSYIGLRDMAVVLLGDCNLQPGDADLAACKERILNEYRQSGVNVDKVPIIDIAQFAVRVPALPETVAGLSDPDEISKALTPQIRAPEFAADGAFEMTLPAAAKGLMRYTVYTTTDLSKPFGEWSLLDEVLKTSEAKKVLANESGMSYTLIRVEDHAVPTIVLPKIGEKRFYRVVGE